MTSPCLRQFWSPSACGLKKRPLDEVQLVPRILTWDPELQAVYSCEEDVDLGRGVGDGSEKKYFV